MVALYWIDFETIPKQEHTDRLLWNCLLLSTISSSCHLSCLSFISGSDGTRIDQQGTARHQHREVARAENGNAGHIIRHSRTPHWQERVPFLAPSHRYARRS